jgi:hypothetical protein
MMTFIDKAICESGFLKNGGVLLGACFACVINHIAMVGTENKGFKLSISVISVIIALTSLVFYVINKMGYI